MVEQDLIICKALVCIFSDEFLAENLAFRGGTALHKLYLQPQIRYSEDIDLVQIHPGPIKPIMFRLGEVLSWMPDKVTKQKKYNNTMLFRMESEVPPVQPIRLKVEINCYEHFNVLGLQKMHFAVDNPWFNGQCELTTYALDELVGTKLRALYQRKKGRDLLDLQVALNSGKIDVDRVLECYRLGKCVPSRGVCQGLEVEEFDSPMLNEDKLLIIKQLQDSWKANSGSFFMCFWCLTELFSIYICTMHQERPLRAANRAGQTPWWQNDADCSTSI